MADSRSKRRGEDLPLPPRPPRRPPPQQPRGQTEEEILRDRSGLDSRFREPMMTNEDPGYIMGGPQMTAPYNFEYMRRQKEKRESEGIRLKKGGPVKKLAAAAKAPGKLGQRARFAQTLAKMKKGK